MRYSIYFIFREGTTITNNDLQKFQILLNTDAEFQGKLMEAAGNYTGEQDLESVFENLLLPLGKEYGLSASYEEFKAYIDNMIGGQSAELSEDELAQVAGGKRDWGAGLGSSNCQGPGLGLGGGFGGDGGGFCIVVGVGKNELDCIIYGETYDPH